MQVGYITDCIEPLHIASDSKWAVDIKSSKFNEEVIPVERHGAILGILCKDDICRLGNSFELFLNRILGKTLLPFLMPICEVIEASSYINTVIERGIKIARWDDPGWYVVEHKHKYFGIVNLRQLIEYTEGIQARDLQRAGEIQKNLLIQPVLRDERFTFLSYNRMANIVGGDWYKLFRINRDMYLVGCFDVAGKNVSGSLVTMSLGTCFATLELVSYQDITTYGRRKKDNPKQITSIINAVIRKVSPPDVFVAGALLYIDFSSKTIEIHNCGLSPVVAFIPTGEKTISYKAYKPNLPPLGLDENIEPDPPQLFSINSGLRITVYSDGLMDMCDIYGERYGEERTIEFLQNLHYIHNDGFSMFIDRGIDLWTKDTALADDVTLLDLRFA